MTSKKVHWSVDIPETKDPEPTPVQIQNQNQNQNQTQALTSGTEPTAAAKVAKSANAVYWQTVLMGVSQIVVVIIVKSMVVWLLVKILDLSKITGTKTAFNLAQALAAVLLVQVLF